VLGRSPPSGEVRPRQLKTVKWAAGVQGEPAKEKELRLIAEVEERHRRAPAQKQLPNVVRETMVALGAERLRKTKGFRSVGSEVVQGLAGMLVKGRCVSTDTKYYNAFMLVQKWAEKVGVRALPMSPFDWMRYMWALFQYSKDKGLARGNIDMERMHRIADFLSPTEDYGAKEVRQSIGRELGVRGKQARPLEDNVLERMLLWAEAQEAGTRTEQLMLVLVLAVMKDGCLRWDDVERVEFGDVLVTAQYARIFVTEGKTDKVRTDFWAMLPRREQRWSGYVLVRRAAEMFDTEMTGLSLAQKG
jgi:hypothetical protein